MLQVVTGSTGIDDFEWGVTLFAVHPDDLKEVVYTMRFDEASALYAEFGPFYTGMVAPLGEVLARRRPRVEPRRNRTQRSSLYRPAIVTPDRRILARCWSRLAVAVVGLGSRPGEPARRPGARRRRARDHASSSSTARAPRDRDDDEPVEGAVIVVTDAADEEVDEVETDEEGRATITLPGEGQYTATLDLDSLPDDVGPARARAATSIAIDPNRSRVLNITLGDRRAGHAPARSTRSRRCSSTGSASASSSPSRSVGLSLIFGTTGLMNFAHGEMVTWGAIVAWCINVDHGDAPHPGHAPRHRRSAPPPARSSTRCCGAAAHRAA